MVRLPVTMIQPHTLLASFANRIREVLMARSHCLLVMALTLVPSIVSPAAADPLRPILWDYQSLTEGPGGFFTRDRIILENLTDRHIVLDAIGPPEGGPLGPFERRQLFLNFVIFNHDRTHLYATGPNAWYAIDEDGYRHLTTSPDGEPFGIHEFDLIGPDKDHFDHWTVQAINETQIQVDIVPITPEPATLGLFSIGALGLCLSRLFPNIAVKRCVK